MYRILIVEDDRVIAKQIENRISSWGYEVKCVEDFQNVFVDFGAFDPHLVLMDISLPFYNGYHWCSEIRKVSKIPILFSARIPEISDNIPIHEKSRIP